MMQINARAAAGAEDRGFGAVHLSPAQARCRMKLFVIEAYGGKGAVNGPIGHFTVLAETLGEAVELIRSSASGGSSDRLEVIEEREEADDVIPRILQEGFGAYMKPTRELTRH